MKNLQISLAANGIFSSISGAVLILTHQKTAQLFGVESSTVFWVIGIGLLLFALSIFIEVKKQRSIFVLLIIVQDVLWVFGSGAVLAFRPFHISPIGNLAIAVVALIVLFFAMAQSKALAQVDTSSEKGMKRFVFERNVNASKAESWKVISDVANYHVVAPNIDEVKILSGEGKGMVRSCSHGKNSWTETCTAWNEEEQYSFEVNTNAPDYPYPLKYLKGTWVIEGTAPNQTKIMMVFEFQYKKNIHNVLLHPFMKGKFNKICDELLDNWQRILEN